jgi:hypothetical protein
LAAEARSVRTLTGIGGIGNMACAAGWGTGRRHGLVTRGLSVGRAAGRPCCRSTGRRRISRFPGRCAVPNRSQWQRLDPGSTWHAFVRNWRQDDEFERSRIGSIRGGRRVGSRQEWFRRSRPAER